MSEAKHTPGPWKVESGEAIYIRAPHGGYVAIIGHLRGRHGDRGRISYDEAHANARLIAAAPKLLAALERLISNRHCFMTSHEDKDWCAQCGENFRHGVHYRVGESAATDIEFALAAIKEAREVTP